MLKKRNSYSAAKNPYMCGFVEIKLAFYNIHNIVINDQIYDSNIYQA